MRAKDSRNHRCDRWYYLQCEEVLDRFRRAGIDIDALAAQLQREGAEEFDKSWNDLLECIASKSEALKKAG
jgi:transaldolase